MTDTVVKPEGTDKGAKPKPEVFKIPSELVKDSTLRFAVDLLLQSGRIAEEDAELVLSRVMHPDEAVRRVNEGVVKGAKPKLKEGPAVGGDVVVKMGAGEYVPSPSNQEDESMTKKNDEIENQTATAEAPKWKIVAAVEDAEPKELESLSGKLQGAKDRAQEVFDGIDGPCRVEVRAVGTEAKKKVLSRGDQDRVGKLPKPAGLPEEETPMAEEAAPKEKKGRAKNPLSFYTPGGQIAYKGVPSEAVMAKKHNVVVGTKNGEVAMANSVHVSPGNLLKTATLGDDPALDVAEITAKWNPDAQEISFKGDPTEAHRSFLGGIYFPQAVSVKGQKKAETPVPEEIPEEEAVSSTADDAPEGTFAEQEDLPGSDEPPAEDSDLPSAGQDTSENDDDGESAGLPELSVEPVDED